MNVTRLRKLIKRRGNFGVAMAGIYLAAHYVWTKHRAKMAACALVFVALSFSVVHPERGPELQTHHVDAPLHANVVDVPPEEETQEAPPMHVKLRMPRRPLISRSRVVFALNKYFCDYIWLSPTHLMMVWSDHPEKSYTWEQYESWTGRAQQIDVQTGRRRPLTGLSTIFQRSIGIPWRFRLGPGGKWLEWTYCCTGDNWPFPAGARLNGSGFQQWSEDKFSETGWLDDHRWIEVGGRDPEDGEDPNPVTLQDLADDSYIELKHDSPERRDIVRRMRALNGGDIYDGQGLETPTEIVLVDAKAVAETYRALREVSGDHIHLQEIRIYKAHRASRIVYAVRFINTSRKNNKHHEDTVEALYVSAADGGRACEIGFVPVEPTETDPDYEDSPELNSVQWLPDDKSISFVYKSKLYVVPAY